MVALRQEPSPSLIEVGARKLTEIRAAAANRATGNKRGKLRSVFGIVGDVLGTLVALVFFVIAAFLVGAIVGFAVAGLAMLLLDFKISLVRRARATERR